MKKSRLLAALLSVLMVLSLLTACGGGNNDTPTTTPDNTPSSDTNTPSNDTQTPTDTQPTGSDFEKVLRMTWNDTPDTFNCQTTSSSYELVSNWTGKLYRYVWDEAAGQKIMVAELADGDPVPQDPSDLRHNMVWTYKVGQNYTFEDGTPIDAHTVEYSIKMLNDPKLANRNLNASGFENGQAYLAGECTWEETGIKVIDDYTIEVTFADGSQPRNVLDAQAFWENIGCGIVHPATYEACLSADGTSTTYGTTLDTIVSSGPYVISAYIPGQYFELTKRTDAGAPLTDVYTVDRVTYNVVTDTNTRLQLFENGEIDAVVANGEAYDEYDGAHYMYQPFTNGIFINTMTPTVEVLKDPNFRYALFWGYDRVGIQQATARSSLATSCHFLPFGLIPDPATNGDTYTNYTETAEYQTIRIDGHEVQDGICYDPDLALEYFNKAYEANGNQKIVVTTIYYDGNGSASASTQPEAIKDCYETLFGADRFEMVLQATPWSVMSEQIWRSVMNYDIALSNSIWNNPTEPWASSNFLYGSSQWADDTFPTQYCNITDEALQKEWSDLYYECCYGDSKFDPQACLDASIRMEEIFYEDSSFIPTHISGSRYFFSSRVEPPMDSADLDLEFAWLQFHINAGVN